MDTLLQAVIAELCAAQPGATPSDTPNENDVKSAFSEAEHKIVRERILSSGKRPDGRTPTEIRPIWCEVGLLHGLMDLVCLLEANSGAFTGYTRHFGRSPGIGFA